MPEAKTRSAFLPIMLLVGCFVVIAGLVLAFVPMVECYMCNGTGENEFHYGRQDSNFPMCRLCTASGRISVYERWFPSDAPFEQPANRGNTPNPSLY